MPGRALLDDETNLDTYFALEELYAPTRDYRKPRRQTLHEELAEVTDQGEEFKITYKPARFEEGWLLSSLRTFFEQNLITDVMMQVKGGKEASVYCCRAHPTTGQTLLAAKVYRPREFRNLRNDAMYREGRQILTSDGRPVKKTDHRILRAIGKKTDFGVQAQHTSWLMHEYVTLERLHNAGAAVPKPYAANDNAILMTYCGDAYIAAPTLIETRLTQEEAEPLYVETLRNIALMLEFGSIHGDLSAYNILYWNEAITLIDFPQVTDSAGNRNALAILRRDVTRVCEYFARQGVRCDPEAVLDDLRTRYLDEEIT
jgi:RIO kinase 1